jgi:hypothetical protein
VSSTTRALAAIGIGHVMDRLLPCGDPRTPRTLHFDEQRAWMWNHCDRVTARFAEHAFRPHFCVEIRHIDSRQTDRGMIAVRSPGG